MNTIHLKIDEQYFWEIHSGEKKFELREVRDRNFKIGDVLALRCDRINVTLHVTVTHLMRGPVMGLAEGWVIMSIERTELKENS